MRSIGRAVALVAVGGMPAIAYVLGRVAVVMWEGMHPAYVADAGVALEDGLTLLAAAVGATIAAYLALTGYAMLLGAVWRGGRAIPRALTAFSPQGWTKVTATALGLSMSAGLAAPALAADGGSTQGTSAGWVAAPVSVVADPAPASLAVGWVEADAASKETSAQASSTHIVQPGESLWRITEALLGAEASAAQIAAAWPELYEANRGSIGDNPSLIQPGTALLVPAGLGS
ncbi:LysM peptidoglycan-binding domain-containing protein [Demequina lutea]|uniref:Nucleoid-associated protein YgaU n=1 Tax=Demequina lutea TaxID=431489 RepID=A0A7Y9Z9M6_9MICO|nr:LysM domain-containing protein [Demequina lutea]NYI40805.1 nucleoid-associated protein YgaU [Demequina lutea]